MPSETGPAHVHDYGFDLPPGLIAQTPPVERSGARMLTLERATGQVRDGQFLDLPEMLRPGDLLALNDSRVFPARLLGRRRGAAGHAEALLTTERAPGIWQALVRPGKKIPVGAILEFPHEGAPLLEAEVVEHGSFGERTLRFAPVADFFSVVERIGQVPLPPYIQRPGHVSTAEDRERYQTVYAGQRGSVAAPTAGLHFTPEVLAAIRARGVELARVTLHVGPGTFQPVRVDTVADIRLHSERYTLSTETAEAVNRARSEGRRIVAVGTTTVRTLEACALRAAAPDAPLTAHSGETDIFIAPGHSFRVVQAMLTNFHLPQSTLLMLVCAFAGYAPVMAAYRHAVAAGYRFFSYGDCMFIG